MDRNFHSFAKVKHTFGQARKSLWIETFRSSTSPTQYFGQARKSLWIETCIHSINNLSNQGQARKSLWIETVYACFCVPMASGSGPEEPVDRN